ncbi:hypothetical protein D9619_011782 [Psilocybe cf. subviscida]|uniref:Uncharacterized protein n=1 Tax=Psilocybe cf. subviscida TaxID=2480587 RepID=A0A8H5EVW3_9AGAR|nr:hypothetical protein D9619_011782 [Psilocybe cf. subviscida]
MREYDFDDDELPLTEEEVQDRFQAPYLLSDSNIPCMIFGEDALCLVFRVPTALFSLHIVVAYSDVDRAVQIITKSLPYTVNMAKLIPNFNNPVRIDPDQTRAYPRSFFLSCIDDSNVTHPSQIIVHPETDFNLDIGGLNRWTSVDVFPDVDIPTNIRLPTQEAMVDSIIDTTLDPNCGLVLEPVMRELGTWLAYIIGYGIRVKEKVLSNGELDCHAQALVDRIKAENRPYLTAWIRKEKGRADDREHCKRRRDIIRGNGEKNIDAKPLPIEPPYIYSRWDAPRVLQ